MNEFRFANLVWIHAIWPVLLIAGLLLVLELRGRLAVDRLISRLMQQRLVHRTSSTRRITAILLATLAMILLIVALMRPQWGRTVERTVRIDSQIMVCLDVSKSMLAEDVAPNRLERAKVELDALLGLMREGQQVGLIAFAGKAAVLSPMTTDFGFLRLVLAEAEPQSVGMGGTKIGSAIQKALDGFREAGDIHRMILLITDGEDHDSFVNDAAKRAKQNGVRIVAVGFGDEAGSKIEITDPKTGVRSFLKDRDGKEVISRLNGEMLRDIALQTDGAYVPAGTGALDLDSIYRNHIEKLLTGSLDAEQRVIRNDAFQWFVLAAMVCLIMAQVSATPWNLRTRALIASESLAAALPKATTTATVLLGTVILMPASCVRESAAAEGRPGSDAVQAQEQTVNSEQTKTAGSQSTDNDAFDEELPPRVIYNQALAYLHSAPDRAERRLNFVRGEAGTDGELRFRALYNLGWVEVNRADALLDSEPEQALQHLHQAANRFREAIRVRPDDVKARQNLEIVSRRILELTDALRKKEPGDLAARLDKLIESTRALQVELQGIVQQVDGEEASSVESFRSEFDAASVSQRQLISEMQLFSDDARRELDAVTKKADDEKSREEKVRAVQLQNMLAFVESGLQRMNKSRSLARRLQGDGAFRRWAAALSDLKRARDQLRHPVEVLGQIVGDASELAGMTRMLAAGTLALPGEDEAGRTPAWLTREYLTDLISTIEQRTGELEQIFGSITAAQEESGTGSQSAAKSEPEDPQMARMLGNIKIATPMLKQARELFTQARSQVETENAVTQALRSEQLGIAQLQRAWELFFDIRRLIELIYNEQRIARGAIEQASTRPEIAPQLRDPLLQAQQTNLQRSAQLEELLQLEIDQLPAAEEAPGVPAPNTSSEDAAQDNEAQRQRLERARELLDQVTANLEQAAGLLEKPATGESEGNEAANNVTAEQPESSAKSEEDSQSEQLEEETSKAVEPENQIPESLRPVAAEVDQSLVALEELRRLFFSLVEHLRDTAQRQANLNDETATTSGEAEQAELPEKSGPLAMRQQQLQDFTRQLAEALKAQSDQAANAAESQAGQPQPADGAEADDPAAAAEKLGRAAELVDDAETAMGSAAGQLLEITQGNGKSQAPFELAMESQNEALQKLIEALAILDQNDPQNQQQPNQANENQNQDQQQADDSQQQKQLPMDAQQLLQLIRDREAERRKEKNRRAAATGAAVDKDW